MVCKNPKDGISWNRAWGRALRFRAVVRGRDAAMVLEGTGIAIPWRRPARV